MAAGGFSKRGQKWYFGQTNPWSNRFDIWFVYSTLTIMFDVEIGQANTGYILLVADIWTPSLVSEPQEEDQS